jgi:hypothetical protein
MRRPEEATSKSTLRASNDDRKRTAGRLRRAAADGRLPAEEFKGRLEAALSARVNRELDALLTDLPPEGARYRRLLTQLVRVRSRIALGAAALLIALVLVTGMLGLGLGRSSAAAPGQHAPLIAGSGPTSNNTRTPATSRSHRP